MPSDPSAFDPYHKWLGIAPKDQPPHHYRLLGIEPFEADVEVIDSAAHQRMVFLAAHSQGAHASRAADLASQVAAARACLLDPQSRSLYDAQLRQRQVKPKPRPTGRVPSAAWRDSPAAQPVPVPVATALETSSAEQTGPLFDPFEGATASTARKAQIKRKAAQRQFRFGLASQVLASAVGLAIGYWIVSSVDPRFDFLNLRGGGELVERPQPSPPRTSDRPSESPPARRPAPGLANDPATPGGDAADGPSKVAANATKKPGDEPAPRAASSAKNDPFVRLPGGVALPPLEEGEPAASVTLAKIELAPGADFELLLKSYITGAKTAKTFRLERVDTTGQPGAALPRWRALAHGEPAADAADAKKPLELEGTRIPVAAFALAGDALTFAWLPEAHTTYAEALRNCVLTLRAGTAEKSLPLRRCEQVDALRLDMDKNYALTPLAPNDFSPPAESLRLELLQAEQLPFGATITPDSKRVGSADEIRIVLRTEAPAVELRARLFTSGKSTSIRVAPVMVDAASKPTPFTLDRLNTLKQVASKEIAKAEKQAAPLEQRIKFIALEVPRLERSVVTTVTAYRKIRAEIDALNAESVRTTAELDRLTKAIFEMKTELRTFDPLFNLANQVRTTAKLHFRVFYVCEEHEVDVLRAG